MALSTIAARRIQSELNDWMRSPPARWRLAACEPITTWLLTLDGEGPLYGGETFTLRVVFSPEYPMAVRRSERESAVGLLTRSGARKAPEFTWLRPSPVHPHIYTNGAPRAVIVVTPQ